MTPRANLTLVTSAKPDPRPTGAMLYPLARIGGRIVTLAGTVLACGRSVEGGQTTDTNLANAKKRLRGVLVELAELVESM